MAPRGYDRYFLVLGMGTHPKLARLSDSERCAHVFGVLAVAASAPTRGCLLVGELPAEAVDVATAAGVTKAIAASAMRKLEAVGVLYHDSEHGCLRVHDWEDVNPPPAADPTGAERQRRRRDRHGPVTERDRDSNGNVTADASEYHGQSNAVTVKVTVPPSSPVPPPSPLKGEAEEEVKNSHVEQARRERRQIFDAWTESTGKGTTATRFDAKRQGIIKRAQQGYPLADLIDAVRGWRHSPHHSGENQTGAVYNDLGLLLRDAEHIEKFRDLERGIGRPSPSRRVTSHKEGPSDLWRALNEHPPTTGENCA